MIEMLVDVAVMVFLLSASVGLLVMVFGLIKLLRSEPPWSR